MLLMDKIDTQLNTFTSTELKLVSYIRTHPNIIFKTINEVIEESSVGYGTVIRFCKKIGCAGFQDFKIRFATENSKDQAEIEEISYFEKYRKQAIKQLNITSRNIDEETFLSMVERIVNAQKIVVIGFGGSFPMAQEFTYRLLRMGFDSISLDADNHIQSYRVSLLSEKDMVFVFSFSGTTKEILETVRLAKKVKAQIVSFTNHVKSPLIALSDCYMITSIRIPALQAELGTRLPFYFLIEILTNYLYETHEKIRQAVKITYDAVSKKQI